jgi:uncharacterized protein YndB with AHSA1/START domain
LKPLTNHQRFVIKEQKMIVQKSIHINSSKEDIWLFLTDPEKIKQWCTTFKEFRYTSEEKSGPGTSFYVEEKVDGPLPLMQIDFSATEWVENEGISFSQVSESLLKSYSQEWKIDPHNSGSKFTFKEEIQMPFGFIGRILEAVAKGSSEATVEKMLTRLKDLVETK